MVLDKPGTLVKVSRIYRDARMHHPVPYKESLWICLRQDVEWWAENPCLHFKINPDRVHYGFFFWRVKPQVMEKIRQDMAQNPVFLSASYHSGDTLDRKLWFGFAVVTAGSLPNFSVRA